ncbi:MAG: HD domain-containing protein [Longimicrobiales bacterium]
MYLRDPLWDTIRLDPVAVRIVDSAAFQRLRFIKQLGLAHLVYPGATHTRFDHALGVYHLAQRALALLSDQGALEEMPALEPKLVPLAALLHDIGHYPFSHAVEELDEDRIPGHHEAVAGRFLADPEVRAALQSVGDDGPERIEQLIRGRSDSALQGLVSGPLDLDKIEYLKRDARFAGVPYGEVDVDRLLHALVLVEDPATGRREVGVHEKGAAALESLLFAKYQMFRNVYWHHAVRAATVMYKRIVDDALTARLLTPEELVGQTDEALLVLLEARGAAAARESGGAGESAATDAEARGDVAQRVARWVRMLRRRKLPKRAAEVTAAELRAFAAAPEPAEEVSDWLAVDTALKRRLEERLACELALQPGSVFVDYPEKRAMFGLDLLVRRRTGEVLRLGPAGREGLIGLPRIAAELYRSARVLRIYTLGARVRLSGEAVARFMVQTPEALRARLDGDEPLSIAAE